MAEKSNGEMNRRQSDETNLEDFIASQMQQQEKASKETDNLDPTKRDNFIARALSESHRMNKEIEKSHEKRDRLHAEFGEERMTDWRNEHAAEVLTAQETSLVNGSFQQDKPS